HWSACIGSKSAMKELFGEIANTTSALLDLSAYAQSADILILMAACIPGQAGRRSGVTLNRPEHLGIIALS
ncbi:MAG: hypothetical protein RMJ82_14610, partial [Gemmatales bacterium]|nr:hypothetical protein [Gemmatales bacterium]